MRYRRVVRFVVLLFVACTTVPARPPEPPQRSTPGRETPLNALEATPDLDGALVGTTSQPTIAIMFASWCGHCHTELAVLATLRAETRILGINYLGHEEYDGRGNADAVRTYVAKHAPWLRVIPADEQLYARLGSPPYIPALYVYDRNGALVATFDRRKRKMPDAGELRALLRRL